MRVAIVFAVVMAMAYLAIAKSDSGLLDDVSLPSFGGGHRVMHR